MTNFCSNSRTSVVALLASVIFAIIWFGSAPSVAGSGDTTLAGSGDATIATRAGDTIWIDVRTPGEYAAGHVTGSLLLPLQSFGETLGEAVPDTTAVLALYCRSGNRSGQALRIARRLGYSRAYNAGAYTPGMR